MFRGNTSETLEAVPVQNVSATPKTDYLCSCGAKRFKWVATMGTIRVGGFKADQYEYECLGCGRKHTDETIRAYFK